MERTISAGETLVYVVTLGDGPAVDVDIDRADLSSLQRRLSPYSECDCMFS